MNYIVLDLEWNQGGEAEEQRMDVMPFEVIEIGAIKLNEKKEPIDQFSCLINPVLYQKLHYVTKKMLGISIEDLRKELSFKEVMEAFSNWCGEEFIFCTWGPLDLLELQRNIRYHGMTEQLDNMPFFKGPFTFLDVQKLFSLQYENKSLRRNLEYAVDFLMIEKDMPFHRAFDDAYYTAKVLQRITDRDVEAHVSFDCFTLPTDTKSEVFAQFSDYEKFISREFADKTEAMQDKNVSSIRCRLCHRNLRKKIRLFSPNGKHYLAVGICPVHGYVKAKIRIKKAESGNTYVVKTCRFVKEEDVALIRLRQEKAKKQKQIKAAKERLEKKENES